MKQRGFTLVEMVIYVTLLTLLLAVVITGLLMVINSFRNVEAMLDIQRNASNSMDRIVREIQGATDVNVGNSVLDDDDGVLSITSGAVVKLIELENGEINLTEDGVLSGALTGDDVIVDSLIFSHVNGVNSDLVRIQMTVSSAGESRSFYNSAVVRGSY